MRPVAYGAKLYPDVEKQARNQSMGSFRAIEESGPGAVGWLRPSESAQLASAAAPRWYAAQTCANRECRIASQLAGRTVEHFLPTYRSVRQWSDRRVCLERALFPGYVFVRVPALERLRVLEIPGVVRLVGFAGRPAPLEDGEVEAIQQLLGAGYRTAPHPYLGPGRRVRLTGGPLRGLEGTIVRGRNRTRFVVSVDLIAGSMSVEVSAADLAL
jgi:transcription antitermination factor NusG